MNKQIKLYGAFDDYGDKLVDQYGRSRMFGGSETSNIFSPVISNMIFAKGFKPFYPNNKSFAFCLSHDIDLLYLRRPVKDRVLSLFGKSTYKSADNFNYVYGSLFKEKPYPAFSLKKLDNINKSWDINSTYYFLSLQEGEQDYNYNVNTIRDTVNLLKERKNEIGLHGGHQAYNNIEKLNQEKELFESVTGSNCVGYRNHYLRFDINSTWKILTKLKFQYDTTFGYPDCVGFKNGMCYPFHPYDFKQQAFLEIVELPLIVMDATFFFYMRLNDEQIKMIIKDLLKKVKAIGGVFTLLWHNNNISEKNLKLYNEVLEIITKEDPWISTSIDIVNWWKQQDLLTKQQSILNDIFAGQQSV